MYMLYKKVAILYSTDFVKSSNNENKDHKNVSQGCNSVRRP